MTLQEIKQWRSHLQASPHTLQRIDALIGMVEGNSVGYACAECAATKKEALKKTAVDFFYWWHNQPGTNTADGFDEWYALNVKAARHQTAVYECRPAGATGDRYGMLYIRMGKSSVGKRYKVSAEEVP